MDKIVIILDFLVFGMDKIVIILDFLVFLKKTIAKFISF